jgi:hypothetical protein
MGVHEEEKQGSGLWKKAKRFWAPFSIILTVLYVWYFSCEVYEHYHPEEKKAAAEVREPANPSLLNSMQASLQHQSDELQQLDPMKLAWVFTDSLKSNECSWLFQCVEHPKPQLWSPLDAVPVEGIVPFKMHHRPFAAPAPVQEYDADPKLLYHLAGPVYVPTARTIKGAPHAFLQMAAAIRDKGTWAVVMFVSCGIIWFALICAVAHGKDSGLAVYIMMIGSLAAVSLMVMMMQGMTELVLTKAGSVLGLATSLLAPSGALALLAGIPHVMKAPGEVKEAVEVIKAVA